YIETLKDGAVENLNIRDKYLERIGKSVERLLNIVKDLDMISQLETGEISLNYSKFDINLLIKEIFELLEMQAQNRTAKLHLQNTSPVFVNADKQKISQVLINLISNAIHYSNREEALIKIKTATNNNLAIIQISDNGMGIKPEALPRIFERFYRVESSRNRKDGGSGLGLAIVKHIMEAHKQNISVESTYLEGTTFTFSLEKAL
ncbi:MAG: GHKL domain-containing protein, partial [Cloacibacterium sp.]|nr:GHKL domain-containing protein [Cloacibacterium sp.]